MTANYFVSLGENCFVRTVLTRRGIKPTKLQGELSCPFDLCVSSFSQIGNIIQSRFSNYFDGLEFDTEKGRFENKKLLLQYQHDSDCATKEIFITRYTDRINNFLSLRHKAELVFACSSARSKIDYHDINNLYKIILSAFKDTKIAFIFMNISKEKMEASDKLVKEIQYKHIPNPYQNYWSDWWKEEFFNSAEGQQFENDVCHFVESVSKDKTCFHQCSKDGAEKSFQEAISNILQNLSSYRVNIKNFGTKNNTVKIAVANGKITEPAWAVNTSGIGKQIQGTNLTNTIQIKALNDGVLHIHFLGEDKRSNGERFPLWIDYKSIKINGKEILTTPVQTWHDKSFKYEMPVKDGEEITLEFEQQYHQYTKEELIETLEKLHVKTDMFAKFLEYYKKNIGFREIEYSWSYVKNNILTQKPLCLHLDDITEETFGRLQITMGNTKFESVLIPSKKKKLYVTPGGYNNQGGEINYPYFSRVSWCDQFDGLYLCFDDPTRIEKHFSPSYYFGNQEENYLEYIKKIVEKIAHLHNISNEDIVFIGSSHTGFAVLYLANEILGSKCIALCPQVDVQTLCGENFSKAMGISYNDTQIAERLNILRFLDNKKSKFFIFSNISCLHDKQQMSLLYKTAGKTLSIGLNQLSETTKCLIAEIPSLHPHWAQPDEYFVKIIEKIMNEPITEIIAQICDSFVGEMKRYYDQNDKLTQRIKELKPAI